jgi:hypothetical protein
MLRMLCYIVVVMAILGVPRPGTAQVPYIQIYFDENLQWDFAGQCPNTDPGEVVERIYIAAHNFNIFMSSIEYRVEYPPELPWVDDVVDPAYQYTGDSPTGIVITFPEPVDGSRTVLLERAMIVWYCRLCITDLDIQVVVVPHPTSGKVRAISWPDGEVVEGVGMRSLICPTLPVESSTWGEVKALYR